MWARTRLHSAFELYADPHSDALPTMGQSDDDGARPTPTFTMGIFKNIFSIKRSDSGDDSSSGNSSGTDDTVEENERISMADRFKETFSRVVKVHFVGAWCVSVSLATVYPR